MLNRRLFTRALATAGAMLPTAQAISDQLVRTREQGYLFDWDMEGMAPVAFLTW